MKIGILALQGAIQEHKVMLEKCNVIPVEIRSSKDMEDIQGLIIPGGESTTIGKLMKKYEIDKEIKKLKLPIYGTCAGIVLLSKEIIDMKQKSLGLMDISIKRNAYGRQIDSFEADLDIKGLKKPFKGVFIRAPVIESFHNGVEILSEFNNKPVLVRQDNILASTFHPELTDDTRIHEYFVGMVKKWDS